MLSIIFIIFICDWDSIFSDSEIILYSYYALNYIQPWYKLDYNIHVSIQDNHNIFYIHITSSKFIYNLTIESTLLYFTPWK